MIDAEHEGWVTQPFDQCIIDVLVRRKSVPRHRYQRSGRYPIVDQGQATVGGYTDEVSHVYQDDLPIILFGDHTRIFKFLDSPFAAGADGTKLFRADEEKLDPRFLFYALRSLDIPERGYNRHFSILREVRVSFPKNKNEQRAIAATLDSVSQAIDAQDRTITALDELKAATMAKLFYEGLREEREQGPSATPVPANWEVQTLADCCDVVSSSLTYTQLDSMSDSVETTAIPVLGIKVSDMTRRGNERAIWHSALSRNLPVSLATRRCVPRDAVVFPKRGAAIATNKKRVTTTWTVLDPNLIAVVPRSRILSGFLYYWFLMFDLTTITEPGATPQLNKKDLIPLPIAFPRDTGEQMTIARILASVDDRIEQSRNRRDRLLELLDRTIQALVSGEVRVTPLLGGC